MYKLEGRIIDKIVIDIFRLMDR